MDLFSLNTLTGLSGLNSAGQNIGQIQREQSAIESFQSILERTSNQENQESNPITDQELKEACQMFESYFIHMMFREMRKTVPSEGILFPKSHGETIFQDLLDEETSKAMTSAGGIGLAEAMYRQMKQND